VRQDAFRLTRRDDEDEVDAPAPPRWTVDDRWGVANARVIDIAPSVAL
jgi:hypothetical protein